MNIKDILQTDKALKTKVLLHATVGKVIGLHIKAGEQLKEHKTGVPALLVCIFGQGTFEDENSVKHNLAPGDIVNIEVDVKHWVNATVDSYFILIK